MSFLRNKDYHILLAGSLPENRSLGVSYTYIGHVEEKAIIKAYNASDVTIVSSIEDNQYYAEIVILWHSCCWF